MGSPRAEYRSDAFGLDLALGFAVPGLGRPAALRAGSRWVSVEGISGTAHSAAWEPRGAVRLWETRSADGRLEVSLDHGAAAYRLSARDRGRYLVSGDGARVRCALPGRGLGWARILTAQVLPLAALLRGLEVFHASAVSLDGEALALIGPSGAGKTTLALELVRSAGAGLLTDDVLAVESHGDAVLAHRGPGVLSPRRSALGPLAAAGLHGLGSVIAHTAKGPLVDLPRASSPLPLTCLYFIQRLAGLGAPSVEPADAEPSLLLGSTFNFVVRSRERVVRQLDICSRLAESTTTFQVSIPDGSSPAEVAQLILASQKRRPMAVAA